MEMPQNIRALYRHWDRHVEMSSSRALLNVEIASPIVREMCDFAHKRILIWQKKVSGLPGPYTMDPILSKYRFCNIFRECDRQTIEIHQWLNPLRDDFALWLLNMFAARMIARPETSRAIGTLNFDEANNRLALDRLLALPRPKYGTPYVFPVSVIQRTTTPTREQFLCAYLPKAIPAVAREIESWREMGVIDGLARILPIFGMNLSFLWTEVLIDVAYQYPDRIDLFAPFPVGPGSRPTMRAIDSNVDPAKTVQKLLSVPFDSNVTIDGRLLRLSAENWEGVGCEFRKYTNLRAGTGRKRRYQ